MLNLGINNNSAPVPQQHATLWYCDQCESFVSIHSVFIVDEASCPACGTGHLELRGTFDSILEPRFADA